MIFLSILLFSIGTYYVWPALGEKQFSDSFSHEGFRTGLKFFAGGIIVLFLATVVKWEALVDGT